MIPLFNAPDVNGRRDERGRFVWLAIEALRCGTDVVLDFGVWSKDERTVPSAFLRGSGCRLRTALRHRRPRRTDAPDQARTTTDPHRVLEISSDELRGFRSTFQEPSATELTSSVIEPAPLATTVALRPPTVGRRRRSGAPDCRSANQTGRTFADAQKPNPAWLSFRTRHAAAHATCTPHHRAQGGPQGPFDPFHSAAGDCPRTWNRHRCRIRCAVDRGWSPALHRHDRCGRGAGPGRPRRHRHGRADRQPGARRDSATSSRSPTSPRRRWPTFTFVPAGVAGPIVVNFDLRQVGRLRIAPRTSTRWWRRTSSSTPSSTT